MSENKYFAAQESKKTANVLLDRAGKWFDNINTTGYKDKLRDMYFAYHGAYFSDMNESHQITFSGEQGELVNLPINHIRNLAEHIKTMITSNRPAMQARATNTDYKSLVQTQLANGLLDYYMREKRLETYLKTAVEYAIVQGAGYIKMEWDATSGEEVDYIEETKTTIYDGDVKFTNLSPLDVVMDSTKVYEEQDWVLVRTRKNKFDVAAKYPEFKEKIQDMATISDIDKVSFIVNNMNGETDDVFIYEFFHKRTDSMKDGRYMMFLSDEIILHDREMPYRTLPIFKLSPGNVLGTPFGYTSLFDILPIQQGINTLYSTILTNQNALGVQNIYVPREAGININKIEGGLNIIEGNAQAGPPTPLNLTSTPPEIFNFLQKLETVAETLSGVNSVARGNAASLGSNPSGTAMALIQSMALQFISGLQQSYVYMIEDVGTALIKMLQDYANSPRLIAIAGKNNRTEMKEFSADKIANISRVIVDIGNPLATTTAGRVQMADQLLQYQMFKSPQQYVNLIHTGKLDVLTDDIQSELLLIQAENEKMVEGSVPLVTVLDDHRQHIIDHRKVLADPSLREDVELVSRVTQHVQEHINQLRQGDPELLQLLGQQPLGGQMAQSVPAGTEGPSEIMQPPMDGQMGIGLNPENDQQVIGPGMESPVSVPNLPTPPEPFQNQPVLASEVPT